VGRGRQQQVVAQRTGRRSNPPATTADGFMLVINKNDNVEQCKRIIAKILSKERYPGNLEAAGSYWFPALKNYANIDFFTKDEWNSQIAKDVLPYALSPFADGGRNAIYDDIGVAAWGEAMQMVGADNKSPEEAIKYLAQKAQEAEEKFKK
jgi:hypothetical protein